MRKLLLLLFGLSLCCSAFAQQNDVYTKKLRIRDSIYFDGSWHYTWPNVNPISESRIEPGNHTAFGVCGKVNGIIFIAQSEGTGHALVANTRPVIYVSSDNGKTYSKSYLPLTGITNASLDDIRNLAGGVTRTGVVWIIATDYRNAAEVLPSRIYRWTSTNNCQSFSNPVEIPYSTSTFDVMNTFGDLVDLGGGVLIFPGYSWKGSSAESYSVQFKSTNNGQTWTVSKIYTGNNVSGSDYVNETSIVSTSGSNLIAIVRREQSKPRLLSSSNSGSSWTSQGVITSFPSLQCHAPYLYKDDNTISCLYSDRTGLNIGRLQVQGSYNSISTWNAAIPQVVAGSVSQRGYGAYNFGYTGTIGSGSQRKMVWYDISLNDNTPANINSGLTSIITTSLTSLPSFSATVKNSSFTAGGSEEDIQFDSVLIYVDNYGGLQRSNYKKYVIPEDGNYLITANIRVSNQTFATYTQLTVYSNYQSTALNDYPILQAGSIGQGFGFINGSGIRQLRKGEEIYFKLYSSTAGPINVNLDSQPTFSITKLD